jgi:predicted GH43/DUF377 family glycosyl hydrolase
MEQSFVIETKQIHVPGYPDAFNPSIVRWNNRLLMTFRSRDPFTNTATIVGFIWLDDDFHPVGMPQLLDIPNEKLSNLYIQDPRLCVIDEKLYMIYSDLLRDSKNKMKIRKMCVAEIEHDGVHFFTTRRDCFLDFQGDPGNRIEKNWVPFDYRGIMLLAYSISPHKIFFPLIGKGKCLNIAQSQKNPSWNWGVLRGGTPALLIDNHYLAFFHSSMELTTVQSKGQSMVHYFMGAYLFEAQPPFSIKKISSKPIVSADCYNGPAYDTWKPLRVVFPCGFIHNKDYIWVSFGKQDHEAWIIKLDKAKLFKSLIPCASHH